MRVLSQKQVTIRTDDHAALYHSTPLDGGANNQGRPSKRQRLDVQHAGQSINYTTEHCPRDTGSINLSADNEAWLNRERDAVIASYPYTAQKGKSKKMAAEIERYLLRGGPEHAGTIRELFEELNLPQVEDLHRTMFDMTDSGTPDGVDRRQLRDALSELFDCLEVSHTYVLEGRLQLPRTTCLFMDMGETGDLTVTVKVGREAGLAFNKRFQPLTHLRYHSYYSAEASVSTGSRDEDGCAQH